jgi:hypothetical protein
VKRFVSRPNTVLPEKPNVDIPMSDISVSRLIDDGLLILHREIANLKLLSVSGKLDPASSRDLRDTVKLLFELKDRENESLKGLTDEQLKEQAKAALE